MISPIEVSHNNVINRLKIVKNTLAELQKLSPPIDGQLDVLKSIVNIDVHDITSMYMGGVSSYLVNYYENKQNALDDFWAFINSKNVVGVIDGCIRRLFVIIENLPDSYDKARVDTILSILTKESEYKITIVIQHTKMTDCECGGRFVIYSDSSEKKCKECGITSTIYGAIFDDMQLYNQDGQKPKQGRHYPGLHCKLWMSRIQAWSGPDIPPLVFSKLHVCVKRDNVNLKKMRCKQVRKYLKECGYSTYNNFVPYIRKVLTSLAPPQLTHDELNRLYNLFNKVAAVLKRLRPNNNITYYPYIIYKIIDAILISGNRKARIIECIHLQSNKTMRFIDDIYGQICDEIDELDHKPTDKHEYDLLL
jgi:hypothetical protein